MNPSDTPPSLRTLLGRIAKYKCLNGWNQDKIAGELSKGRIQWVLNPPAAPHTGGSMGTFGEILQESP